MASPFGDDPVEAAPPPKKRSPFGDDTAAPPEPSWLERIGQYLTTADPAEVERINQGLQENSQGGDFNWRTIPSAIRSIPEGIAKAGSGLVNWERENIPGFKTLFPEPALSDADIETPIDIGLRTLGMEDQTIKDVTKYQPQTPEEQMVSMGIQFLPALYGGGGPLAAKMLTRVGGPMAAVEGVGAGAEALDLPPEAQAAAQFLAGVLTAGRPLAPTQELASAVKALNVSKGGARALEQLLRESGMPEQDLYAGLDRLGVKANVMDVNPNALQSGQQVYSKGGTGRDVLARELTRRDMEGAGDTQVSLRQNLGPEVNETAQLQALQDRLSTLGKEQRQAAKTGQTGPANLQSIVDDIDTRLGTEKSPTVRKALEAVRESLHIKQTAPNQPAALETASEPILSARQAIREQLYDANGQVKAGIGPKEEQVLKELYAKINEQLDVTNPSLRAKDAEIEGVAKEERAYQTGRDDVISKGAGKTASPAEFADTWGKMSAAERNQALAGLTRTIDEIVGGTTNDRVALKKIIVGEGKWNQQKIEQVIGPEKADRLMRTLEQQSAFQNTRNKVMEGSKTADTMTVDKMPGGIAMAQNALKYGAAGGVLGGPVGGGLGIGAAIAEKGLGAIGKSMMANRREDLARLLASGQIAEVRRAMEAARGTRGIGNSRTFSTLGPAAAVEDRR